MSTAIVIPARLHSTRLPRKLLLDMTGKTVLQHTYEMAHASGVAPVYVATDSLEIEAAVMAFGGEVIMTPAMLSGTARVAWVTANRLHHIDHVINLQADEPELDPQHLKQLAVKLQGSQIATLASPIFDWSLMECPSVVKVVLNFRGEAMYFSRSAIPWVRADGRRLSYDIPFGLRHVGVYGYQRSVLEQINRDTATTPLVKSEDLEQLLWLQRGWVIGVDLVENSHPGIDTVECYDAFCARIQQSGRGKS